MKNAYEVIKKPIISERSMDVAQEKKYTFEVAKEANKTEIKAAVEELFPGVEVKKVNVQNYDGKLKRVGLHQGRTPQCKKAIVTLTEKSKEIEFFQGL